VDPPLRGSKRKRREGRKESVSRRYTTVNEKGGILIRRNLDTKKEKGLREGKSISLEGTIRDWNSLFRAHDKKGEEGKNRAEDKEEKRFLSSLIKSALRHCEGENELY